MEDRFHFHVPAPLKEMLIDCYPGKNQPAQTKLSFLYLFVNQALTCLVLIYGSCHAPAGGMPALIQLSCRIVVLCPWGVPNTRHFQSILKIGWFSHVFIR